MDHWENNLIDHRRNNRRDNRHPSFSSTLLDQIYRSIDDSSTNSDLSMRKKQNRAASLDDNRVCLEKILVNRRATATANNFVRSRNPKTVESVFFKHTSSSSSDSSGFSSSESDSFYRRTRSSRSPSAICHPKPIRTTVERFERSPHRPNSNKQEHGSFLRTKSKALKIYSDLKKVKQPISPGGRLATFLNSLFTGAGNTKKPNKINTTVAATATATVASSTTCSSASSFSRSCLSKTTSSSEKSKRSVRFCPVNVILDEDSKRSGHNNNNKLYGNNERESTRHHQSFDTLEIRVMEENRRVIEAAKELIRNYQKNKDVVSISAEEEEEEDEEDDDAASCASSDLFELDNLSAIGIDRYREELPVYETTRLNTNRIISR